MSLSLPTARDLMLAHIENATAPTERPVSLEPYRTRRGRAGWIRIGLGIAALAAFALPLIGSY